MTPLDAVVRILNNQLSSLMWIEEKVSASCIHSLSICKTFLIHDDSKIDSMYKNISLFSTLLDLHQTAIL